MDIAISCRVLLSRLAVLALPYPEHLGAAYWATPLGCRFAIFHSYCFSVLYLSFIATLHTVSLHFSPLLF